MGDLEKNSIVKITPDLKMQTIVKDDEKLIWPDSYSISDDGYLYISNSQIQLMPWFHNGKEQFKNLLKSLKLKFNSNQFNYKNEESVINDDYAIDIRK